ncbi:MAG: hypothetical protein WKG07_24660 [Hymenobacter sp.]
MTPAQRRPAHRGAEHGPLPHRAQRQPAHGVRRCLTAPGPAAARA